MPSDTDKLEFWFRKLDEAKEEILESNFRQIKRYVRRAEANGLSTKTIMSNIQVLIPFSKFFKKEFESLTEDDIFDYSEELKLREYGKKVKHKYTEQTQYYHKSVIQSFLKNINKDACASIVLKKPKHELPEILSIEDIDAMIKHSLSARDRALLACLYESGARKGELLSIKIKHVSFDENGVVLIIPKSKTGSRRIRLVFSASYLREWLEVHPAKEDRESIVFCSLRTPYGPISTTGLLYQLRGLAKRAGVTKRVNPHSFRHAAATNLAKHLTEQELKIYLGWTQASSMAAVYVHLAGEDIDNAILNMHGLKTENSEDNLAVTRCPRCKELLPSLSAYCNKCGLPLQDSFRKKVEADMTEIDIEIIKAALQDPRVLDEITKRVNSENK